MKASVKQWLFRSVFWLFFVLVLLLSVLPLAIRMGTVWWLEQQGLNAQFKHLDFALLPGRVTVEELSWHKQGAAQFSLQSFSVDWQWRSVITGSPKIENLGIHGLSVHSDYTATPSEPLLTVAGLPIPVASQTQITAAEPESSTVTKASNFAISVDNFKLSDWTLCHNAESQTLSAEISEPINACLSWRQLAFNKGFNVQIGKALKVNVHEFLIDELIVNEGAQNSNINMLALKQFALSDIKLQGEQLSVAKLNLAELAIKPPTLTLLPRLPEQLGWRDVLAEGIALDMVTSNINLTEFVLDDFYINDLGKALLSLSKLQVNSVSASPRSVAAKSVNLHDLAALDRELPLLAGSEIAPELKYIAQVDQLAVSGIDLMLADQESEQLANYTVQKIELLGPKALVVKNGQSQWLWQPVIDEYAQSSAAEGEQAEPPSDNRSTTAEAASEPAKPSPDLHFSLGELVVAGDNKLAYYDGAIEPAVELEVHQLDLRLGAINSLTPTTLTPVSFAAQVGEFGSLNLTGTAAPLASPLNMNLTGVVSDIALHPASPYLRKFIGQRIRTGQLSQDITINVVDDKLDSLIDIQLHKLQLTGKAAANEQQDESGNLLPIGVALNLLRDGNDRIRLKLPVKGDVHDPSISPNQILAVVLRKALTEAVLQYYSPFGLVSLARFTLGEATKLRFKPLVFAPGSSKLNEQVIERLNELPPLLAKRPNVTMTFCAKANGADQQTLTEQMAAGKDEPASAPTGPEDPKQKALQSALRDLAQGRGANVKRYLVDAGVEGKQVALCEPELDLSNTGDPEMAVAI